MPRDAALQMVERKVLAWGTVAFLLLAASDAVLFSFVIKNKSLSQANLRTVIENQRKIEANQKIISDHTIECSGRYMNLEAKIDTLFLLVEERLGTQESTEPH